MRVVHLEIACRADVRFWVLHVAEARFVDGFGAAGWLQGERLSTALAQ
jgi:hypothetical protein